MTISNHLRHVHTLLTGLIIVGTSVSAEPAVETTPRRAAHHFLRIDDSQTPRTLQTSIVQYSLPDGRELALVGAVHLAHPEYYAALNELFVDFDVVLYEMIVPDPGEDTEGAAADSTSVGPGMEKETGHDTPMEMRALSGMQSEMTEQLGLSFQLDGIDYSAENFVHADMTDLQFQESMEARGESFFSAFARLYLQALSQPASVPQLTVSDMLVYLMAADKHRAMRVLLAEQLAQMEKMTTFLEGPAGSTIVTERNKVVVDRFRETLAGEGRSFAIFYGAAHMPDLEQRLVNEFDLLRSGQSWLDAWSL